MTNPTESKQYTLARQPKSGIPTWTGADANFQLETKPLPQLKAGDVLVKTLHLSNDPAQRGWISANTDPERLYVPPVKAGDMMRASGIAEVVDGNGTNLQAGQKVLNATLGWREFAVLPANTCIPLPDLPPSLGVTTYLGALGMTGLTAYYGLVIVGECKADDTVVVSGAAGAVGSMVVQLAKNVMGCKRVVGIAGTDEKCEWVKSFCGADACVNYKAPNYFEQLASATSDRVELFFDNVAGDTLDFMLTRMKTHGRVVQCGGISTYNNDAEPMKWNHFVELVFQRISLKGFIVLDYLHKRQEVTGILLEALKKGTLKLGKEMETVVEAKFEDIPKVWTRLFEGGNRGKLVTSLV